MQIKRTEHIIRDIFFLLLYNFIVRGKLNSLLRAGIKY
jgi:hypothetical protein